MVSRSNADSILPEYPAEDPVFFNFQIDSKSKTSILNLKIEWPAPSPSDIDVVG